MAGVRAANCDGFVSTRSVSAALGELLADELAQPPSHIQAAHQEDCKEAKSNNHTVAAAEFISQGSFVLVLLGPTGLARSRPDQDCYQLQELRRTMERAQAAEGSRDSFRVFFALLQDKAGYPDWDTYVDGLREEENRDETILRWMAGHHTYYPIRNYTDTTSSEFETDARALIGKIRNFIKGVRNSRAVKGDRSGDLQVVGAAEACAPSDERSKPPANAGGGRVNFEQLERKYLKRAVEGWSLGAIGDVSGRGGDSAFKFRPGRFVEFSANQHSRDGSHERTVSFQPLSYWLFRTQELPLLMVGEGGAGKTTALTAAACAFAAKREEHCRRRCGEIAEGQWLQTATELLSQNDRSDYVPVAMRCVDALEAMGERRDSQALLSAALAHMLRVAELGDPEAGITRAERDAFYERLSQQAYVFMLDGLDELANESAAEDLFNTAYNLALDLSDVGLRVIFTTRDVYSHQFRATRIVLDKPLGSEASIETFIARFADNADSKHRLLDAAKAVRKRGDAGNFALRTPLLLNAFCCIALEDDYDPGASLANFCKRTIDYLVNGRKFRALAKAQGDHSKKIDDIARDVLRRFALAFVSISGKGVIRQGEDETAAWLRRESASLGLNTFDAKEAKEVLRELAMRTNLFRLEKGGTYTFDNTTMFWEYLAAEEMKERGLTLHLTDAERLKLPAWRSAIRFAHAISVDSAVDGHELDAPLTLLDEARGTSNEVAAWSTAELALQLLAENPTPDLLDGRIAPSLVTAAGRATEVYHMFKARWNAATRATFCDLFFQIGRRDDGEKTAGAVDQLREIFLRPRRRWIAIAAEGLPAGYQIADSHVLVAEYRRFAEDISSRDEKLWPPPDYTAKVDPRLRVDDLPDDSPASLRRFDGWVMQMDRPGSPVVSVSFHEAVAYCNWKTKLMREAGELKDHEVVRLPTEGEWAALLRWSAKGAEYPWGKQSLSEQRERVNWRGADVDHASSPGVFAAIGEEGLYDLGSNVSCWAVGGDGVADWPPEAARVRPVCGGCWFEFKPDVFQINAKPNLEAPTHRGAGIGFRLVRAPIKT